MSSNLDLTFAALADPTRRAIVARLAASEATVAELIEPFTISPPAISRHLRVLMRANLIRQERTGKFRRCSLVPEGLGEASAWLEFHRGFWRESFEKLDEHLKKTARVKGTDHGRLRKARRKG